MDDSRRQVAFLFIGGIHQVLHAAPAAAELSCNPRFAVTCYYAGDDCAHMLGRVASVWPGVRWKCTPLYWPRLLNFLPSKYRKIFYLLLNFRKFSRAAAVITTERTSTLLKRLGVRCMIHLPHGTGDGARGFEARLRRFDLVIVAGEKDAARMQAEGVVAPERCRVCGSVKLGAVARLAVNSPPLFENKRPVVLYNPHFNFRLSSWALWGEEIVRAFAGQDEYNLVLAPHIRMASKLPHDTLAAAQALAIPGRILVDVGSMRSCDMSYTLGADIYIGDVSSQIYEFLSRPRPCVFLNAHGVSWRSNPDYACWHFGEVVDRPEDVLAAVCRATERHAAFLPLQQSVLHGAFTGAVGDAPRKAARAIAEFLEPPPV